MSITQLIVSTYPRLMQGLWMTVQTTLISLFFAAILGLLFGLCSVSKNVLLRGINRIYINIFRGTPLIIQAMFIYFGLPNAFDFRLEATLAGIITLSLNAGAYTAEIVRGGIQSVNKGQMEAARSLGLPYSLAMRKVILPQALRTMAPSLVNQCIITLKDTSILSVIGMTELTQVGKLVIAVNFESFKMWTIIAIIYFVIIYLLTKISDHVERSISYGKSNN